MMNSLVLARCGRHPFFDRKAADGRVMQRVVTVWGSFTLVITHGYSLALTKAHLESRMRGRCSRITRMTLLFA